MQIDEKVFSRNRAQSVFRQTSLGIGHKKLQELSFIFACTENESEYQLASSPLSGYADEFRCRSG